MIFVMETEHYVDTETAVGTERRVVSDGMISRLTHKASQLRNHQRVQMLVVINQKRLCSRGRERKREVLTRSYIAWKACRSKGTASHFYAR